MKTIPLTQNKVALVDDCDYERLSPFRWYAKAHRNTYYAVRSVRIHRGYSGQRQVKMHSEILQYTFPMQCDHIDGNGLNNQRENLRVVTPRENSQNKHIIKGGAFIGVSYFKRLKIKPWVAAISIGRRDVVYLGCYSTGDEAQAAYTHACNMVELIRNWNVIIKIPMILDCD